MSEQELQRLRADFVALRTLSILLAHRLSKIDPSIKELLLDGYDYASQLLLSNEALERQGDWAIALQIAHDDLKNRLTGI